MKKIILIFIVLAIKINAQVTGSTVPGKIVLKNNPVTTIDKTVPFIYLLEPLIKPGSELKITRNILELRGEIKTSNEISSFWINSKIQPLPINNKFDLEYRVPQGKNQIIITATDKFGNRGSYSFLVNCVTDTIGPFLTLIEPKPIDDRMVEAAKASQTLIVEALDENGVKDVLINDKLAGRSGNNQFFANVKLNLGINTISLTAHDSLGNVSSKTVKINYATDSEPPLVTLTDPSVGRGTKVVSKKEVITVKGVAADESGVKSITINGRNATLKSDGNFMLDMDLSVGDNAIIIKAVDNLNNSGIDTFYVTRKLEDLIATGKYYALVVGIDKYKGTWPKLRNAVNDARAFADLLKREYKFDEIKILYDDEATRTNIISEFERLTSVVGKDDNVLIFYSGHGEFKQQLNKGYWVPSDALNNSTAGYISNNDIQTFLNGINSKHTLLISDACFSGDIFRGKTETLPFEDSERYYKEAYRRISRCALTSGGIEPVTDGGKDGHSVFAYYLLKKLQDNDNKYFTAGQLFNDIQIPVTNNSEQTPVFQPIKNTGDEGGQFIFIKK